MFHVHVLRAATMEKQQGRGGGRVGKAEEFEIDPTGCGAGSPRRHMSPKWGDLAVGFLQGFRPEGHQKGHLLPLSLRVMGEALGECRQTSVCRCGFSFLGLMEKP